MGPKKYTPLGTLGVLAVQLTPPFVVTSSCSVGVSVVTEKALKSVRHVVAVGQARYPGESSEEEGRTTPVPQLTPPVVLTDTTTFPEESCPSRRQEVAEEQATSSARIPAGLGLWANWRGREAAAAGPAGKATTVPNTGSKKNRGSRTMPSAAFRCGEVRRREVPHPTIRNKRCPIAVSPSLTCVPGTARLAPPFVVVRLIFSDQFPLDPRESPSGDIHLVDPDIPVRGAAEDHATVLSIWRVVGLAHILTPCDQTTA
jgi:hypothetical protein